MQNILTITQINKYVHSLFESNANLRDICLKGEISNLSYYSKTGSYYLSLKDNNAQIKAVIFNSNAKYLMFKPENGSSVIARGQITLYEKDGSYQFVISELIPEGIGEQEHLLNKLKEKLSKEGLLSYENKLPFPKKIHTIGIVTSNQGAVIHDIESVVYRKKPYYKIILSPASVQGENTSNSVIKALDRLFKDGRSDIIIIARGGGSREDLWGFQSEELVRKIANTKIPIISAIGHESDYTLCDLAASFRAATPTAAAEIACGSGNDINIYLKILEDNLNSSMNSLVDKYTEKMYNISSRLEILNPLNTLKRGFSITTPNSITDIKVDDIIETTFIDGKTKSKVTEVICNDL